MPKTADHLTRQEKNRLAEAVRDLIDTLGWTPTQLARHLGYGGPSMIHRVRKAEAGMAREKFSEVLRLVENCSLPEDVSAKDTGERAKRPWIQPARDLWADLRRRGIRTQMVAEAVGYTSATTFSGALRDGFLPEERYHLLVRFGDQCRESARPVTAQSTLVLEPEPRPTEVIGVPVSARTDASAGAVSMGTPATGNRGPEPVVPIFTVLRQAHDQLGRAVKTLDRGIAMANVLVAPGMKLFRTRVAEIQRTLEEALAMQ
jgi:AraC-like DNA-binding protein